MLQFCHHNETPPVQPVMTFSQQMTLATHFREHIRTLCTRKVCAVCAIEQIDTSYACITDVVGVDLLLANIESSPDAPRDALTTTVINGMKYCIHPDAVQGSIITVCNDCKACLARGEVPLFSLVRIDPGPRPSDLVPLTFFEERLVSLYRTTWKTVFVLKPTGGPNLPPHARQKAAKGHVIAFPNPTPDDMVKTLLRPLHTLTDDLLVVFLNYSSNSTDLHKLAEQYPAIKVRGKEVVKWSIHLCKVRLIRMCTSSTCIL